MNHAEFQLRGVGDPRLAVHATSALPAWLWSVDGVRILWANPVGARVFGAANGASLRKGFSAPPTRIADRWRSLQAGSRRAARSGWSGCAVLARRLAG